jgi:hypothetical protein
MLNAKSYIYQKSKWILYQATGSKKIFITGFATKKEAQTYLGRLLHEYKRDYPKKDKANHYCYWLGDRSSIKVHLYSTLDIILGDETIYVLEKKPR